MENTKTLYELDMIGFLGPLIVVLVNVYNLLVQPVYLAGYVLSLLVNSVINMLLKSYIQESRPSDSINIVTFDTHRGADIYGMPSGHAQSVAFSTMYIYLVQKSMWVLMLDMIILSLTVLQRWNYRKHTIYQLSIGCIIGAAVGYISYTVIKKIAETPTKTHNIL